MIFETAIGDAYAVAWEFIPEGEGPVHDWSGYRQRPRTGDRDPSPAGSFTDDTIRTMVNARVILAGDAMDTLAYVREMKRAYREDPRLGWSRKFQAFLADHVDRPDRDWFAALQRRNTNGALMGAPVMGMLPDPVTVATASSLQAIVTHDLSASRSAAAVSLAAFAVRTRACAPRDLLDYVFDQRAALDPDLRAQTLRSDRVDMSAARTAGAIFRVLMNARSQRETIDMTLQMGGDTDSVAAACLGIASLDPDRYAPDLPDWAMTDLEGQEGGPARQALRDLDAKLSRL